MVWYGITIHGWSGNQTSHRWHVFAYYVSVQKIGDWLNQWLKKCKQKSFFRWSLLGTLCLGAIDTQLTHKAFLNVEFHDVLFQRMLQPTIWCLNLKAPKIANPSPLGLPFIEPCILQPKTRCTRAAVHHHTSQHQSFYARSTPIITATELIDTKKGR